jgi:hypothetical protein
MDFEIYCDESRAELFKEPPGGNNFVLIGGIWIKAEDREEHKAAIKAIRSAHSLYAEFKWKKVSPSHLHFYKDLIQMFFERDIRFRTLVLRADELNAVRFHQSDNELMFYKFYYQLLHHWIIDFNNYRIFLDTKTNRLPDRLKTLGQCLSNSNITSSLKLQALPSHELDLIQLADLLIGTVSYRLHGRDSSPAKMEVLGEMESCLGREIGPTSRDEGKFNVFRFRSRQDW